MNLFQAKIESIIHWFFQMVSSFDDIWTYVRLLSTDHRLLTQFVSKYMFPIFLQQLVWGLTEIWKSLYM